MGGLSSEQAVSINTGEAVLAALTSRGYDAEPIFVDHDLDLVLRQAQIDVAFIALHGRYGEDGCVQGLLETLGIPYTGSDVLSSALAMNKGKAKELFRLHNLPTPSYYVMHDDDDALACHGDFGYPVVVKPVNEGSSVGVAIVNTPAQLVEACERAFRFDHEVLVERFIDGKEVSVAVLDDRPLGAVEIEPSAEFYDYGAKYASAETAYHVPPRISPERYRGVLTQALRAHRALGCSGATRVDLIVSETGNEYILEVNSVPGLTPTSLLPKIAHAAGIDFEQLCDDILQGARLATRRGANRRRSGTGRADRDHGRQPDDARTSNVAGRH